MKRKRIAEKRTVGGLLEKRTRLRREEDILDHLQGKDHGKKRIRRKWRLKLVKRNCLLIKRTIGEQKTN